MGKVRKRIFFALVILLTAFGLFHVIRHNMNSNGHSTTGIAQSLQFKEKIEHGELLAKKYCQSCHLFPEPELLSKAKWKNILPQMGIRMGIKSYQGQSYMESVKSDKLIVPEKPVVSEEEWTQIIDYYSVRAPFILIPGGKMLKAKRQMPFFSVRSPGENFSGKQVLASFVKIDTTGKTPRLWVANAQSNQLLIFDHKLKLLDSITTPGPVVDVSFCGEQILVCVIGKDLAANDETNGRIYRLQVSASGKMKLSGLPLLDSLSRPVQLIQADLNGDGKKDLLICEFGNLTGALLWMENTSHGYIHHVIRNLPGAIKAYVDFRENPKLPNLWVLFTQAQEKIVKLINRGNGNFEEKTVLQFPPIYGSSSFEMVDMNHDGYIDIIYTCGDNGNATAVLKPYHGVYIFLNDGRESYHQEYFYPLNGCYKAIARDFNQDGNVDIAVIGLYTDSRCADEGFVFLKGDGGLKFSPYALPSNIMFERGITMDAGDMNEDGKQDLIVGNSFFDFGPFGRNIREPLFYLFSNRQQ